MQGFFRLSILLLVVVFGAEASAILSSELQSQVQSVQDLSSLSGNTPVNAYCPNSLASVEIASCYAANHIDPLAPNFTNPDSCALATQINQCIITGCQMPYDVCQPFLDLVNIGYKYEKLDCTLQDSMCTGHALSVAVFTVALALLAWM